LKVTWLSRRHFWTDDELIQAKRSPQQRTRNGHLPLWASAACCGRFVLEKTKRVLIHIKN